MATKLERLNRLWQRLFIRYYASAADVESLFDGRLKPRRARCCGTTSSTSAIATTTTAR